MTRSFLAAIVAIAPCVLALSAPVAGADGDGPRILVSAASARVAPGARFRVAAVHIANGVVTDPADLALAATGAAFASLPSGDPLVVAGVVTAPATGTFTVTAVHAETGDTRTFTVDPALLAPLVVTLDPPTLTKGQSPASAVVTVTGPPGAVPSIEAALGTIDEVALVAPGRWRARYTPSGAPYPEVDAVIAWRAWPDTASDALAFGAGLIEEPAAIVLPGESKPNVQVVVEIAKKSFGPVPTDERGRFDVPVVVPPGVGFGTGTSTDRLGNKKVTSIDLRVPPVPKVALFALPRTPRAGSASTIAVVALAPAERAASERAERTPLVAKRGKIGDARAAGPGRALVRYTAPATPGDDVVEVKGDRLGTSVALAVRPGAPTSAALRAKPSLLAIPAGGKPATAALALEVADEAGVRVMDARVDGAAELGVVALARKDAALANAEYRAEIVRRAHSDVVTLRARSAFGVRAERLAWDGRALVVEDALGRPVPRATAALRGGAVRADAEGALALGPANAPGLVEVEVALEGASEARVFFVRDAGGALHAWPRTPGAVLARAEIGLIDPLPVDVVARLVPIAGGARAGEAGAAGASAVQFRVEGGADPRTVVIAFGDGTTQTVQAREGSIPLPDGALPVVVQDVDTGVAAVVLAP